VIKRKLAGVYGPNLKCTKPADSLTDRSVNQTHPTRELLILVSVPPSLASGRSAVGVANRGKS
jgi:hypothetical protein